MVRTEDLEYQVQNSKWNDEKVKAALLLNNLVDNDHALKSAIFSQSELIHFAKGSKLIEEGATDDDVFFVLEGKVDIKSKNKLIDQKEATDAIGELAAIKSGSCRTADVFANSHTTTCLKINGTSFRNLMSTYSGFKQKVDDNTDSLLRQKIEQVKHWGKDEYSWLSICIIFSLIVSSLFGLIIWQNNNSLLWTILSSIGVGAVTFIFLLLANPLFIYRRIFQVTWVGAALLIFYKLSAFTFNLNDLQLPFSLEFEILGTISITEFVISLLVIFLFGSVSAFCDYKLNIVRNR